MDSIVRGRQKVYFIFACTLVFFAVGTGLFLLLRSCEPTISMDTPSGFYDEPFELVMTARNGSIYYTLDCSRPDTDSILYTGPVYITDASLNENYYSMRRDTSVSFLEDIIREREAGRPEDYRTPDVLIDKCTVVRAVCIDRAGGRSEEVCATYYVGYDKKQGYDGLLRVSLYTDPENLFDYEDGIYVTGKKTDEYLEGKREAANDDLWWWWPANYRMKGSSWERPARVEIFGEDGEKILSKDVGVRVQGGGSRGYLPRSLSLYARQTYDGTDVFEEDIFEDGTEADVITLFSGGDSRITKLEDYLPASLCGELDISMMKFRPAVLFLEGEFWGFYFITEKYDGKYFETHYGVDGDDVIMIKENEVSLGDERDMSRYEADMAFLKHADVTTPEGIEAVEKRIDLDSYIDYYALQLYIDRRNDWPYMNCAAWRTREADAAGGYGDGRWRWILFDDNSGAYGLVSVSSNSIENTRAVDPALDNLLKSPVIEKKLRDRMLYIGKNMLNTERVSAFVEEYKKLVSPAMHNEFIRFYGDRRDYDHSFDVRCDRFVRFFDERYTYLSDIYGE